MAEILLWHTIHRHTAGREEDYALKETDAITVPMYIIYSLHLRKMGYGFAGYAMMKLWSFVYGDRKLF